MKNHMEKNMNNGTETGTYGLRFRVPLKLSRMWLWVY